jgi:hypothetical protein
MIDCTLRQAAVREPQDGRLLLRFEPGRVLSESSKSG